MNGICGLFIKSAENISHGESDTSHIYAETCKSDSNTLSDVYDSHVGVIEVSGTINCFCQFPGLGNH